MRKPTPKRPQGKVGSSTKPIGGGTKKAAAQAAKARKKRKTS